MLSDKYGLIDGKPDFIGWGDNPNARRFSLLQTMFVLVYFWSVRRIAYQKQDVECLNSTPRDRIAVFSQMIFSDAFSWKEIWYFDAKFPDVCSWRSN